MRAITASGCYKGSVGLVDCLCVRVQIFGLGTTKHEILHLSRTLVLALVRKVGIDTKAKPFKVRLCLSFIPGLFLLCSFLCGVQQVSDHEVRASVLMGL